MQNVYSDKKIKNTKERLKGKEDWGESSNIHLKGAPQEIMVRMGKVRQRDHERDLPELINDNDPQIHKANEHQDFLMKSSPIHTQWECRITKDKEVLREKDR